MQLSFDHAYPKAMGIQLFMQQNKENSFQLSN